MWAFQTWKVEACTSYSSVGQQTSNVKCIIPADGNPNRELHQQLDPGEEIEPSSKAFDLPSALETRRSKRVFPDPEPLSVKRARSEHLYAPSGWAVQSARCPSGPGAPSCIECQKNPSSSGTEDCRFFKFRWVRPNRSNGSDEVEYRTQAGSCEVSELSYLEWKPTPTVDQRQKTKVKRYHL